MVQRNAVARFSVARSAPVFGLIMLGLTVSALAQGTAQDAPDSQSGRYLFEKQADGFIRLDTKTGEVALCRAKTVGLACEAAPEDRAVIEDEIARLHGENAALKKALIARGLPLPSIGAAEPAAPAAPPVAQQSGPANDGITLRLPTNADIDRAVAFAGRVWHRFVEAVERAQKQVFSKS